MTKHVAITDAEQQTRSAEVSAEQIERRSAAALKLQEIARQLDVGATQAEIKQWINDGRH
jgi:hypothetical protein